MKKPLPQHSVLQWHPEKNTISIESVSGGSRKTAWWKCPECSHEWSSQIQVHANGAGCPACRRAENIRNLDQDPLVVLWSPENSSTPEEVLISEEDPSRQWACASGHSWTMSVLAMRKRSAKGSPCPVCSGRRRKSGSNRLSDSPAAALWNEEHNEKNLSALTTGSNVMAHWKCSEGHEWEEMVLHRCRLKDPTQCPDCSAVDWAQIVAQKPHLDQMFAPANTVARTQIKSMAVVLDWICTSGHSFSASLRQVATGGMDGCGYCRGSLVDPAESLAARFPQMCSQWSSSNDRDPSTVTTSSPFRASWRCSEGHEWSSPVYSRTRGSDGLSCPLCDGSAPENELRDFLMRHLTGHEVLLRDRKMIAPYELDMVIPERRVAVEYHGLRWHGEEMGKERDYHLRKLQMARDAGYQLVTVWEDDWRERRGVVESMLLHKLGLSSQDRIGARKTTVMELDSASAHRFENDHHIQGASRSGYHIGLLHEGRVVAVCSYSVRGVELEIERYCTSDTVVGGFTKLLTWIERTHAEITRIVTFADHEVSDGMLYARHGFIAERVLDPDYKYVQAHRRVHKFNFRRARFRDDPSLIYREDLSEAQMAALNGLDRVWDCGKTRYVKSLASGVAGAA